MNSILREANQLLPRAPRHSASPCREAFFWKPSFNCNAAFLLRPSHAEVNIDIARTKPIAFGASILEASLYLEARPFYFAAFFAEHRCVKHITLFCSFIMCAYKEDRA